MHCVKANFPGSNIQSATAYYSNTDRDLISFNRAAFVYGCNLNSLNEAFIQLGDDKPDCYMLLNDPEKSDGDWIFRKCHDFI